MNLLPEQLLRFRAYEFFLTGKIQSNCTDILIIDGPGQGRIVSLQEWLKIIGVKNLSEADELTKAFETDELERERESELERELEMERESELERESERVCELETLSELEPHGELEGQHESSIIKFYTFDIPKKPPTLSRRNSGNSIGKSNGIRRTVSIDENKNRLHIIDTPDNHKQDNSANKVKTSWFNYVFLCGCMYI